jgi:hypothetical protein
MAMKERVAATLERREFSFVGLIPATTIATLSAVFRAAMSKEQKTAAADVSAPAQNRTTASNR